MGICNGKGDENQQKNSHNLEDTNMTQNSEIEHLPNGSNELSRGNAVPPTEDLSVADFREGIMIETSAAGFLPCVRKFHAVESG